MVIRRDSKGFQGHLLLARHPFSWGSCNLVLMVRVQIEWMLSIVRGLTDRNRELNRV